MSSHNIPSSASDDSQTLFALNELITATSALAETLKETARELHEDLGLSVPERSILLDLRKNGPLTVPTLAKHREVSRQFVQATVNPLIREGILASRTNPAHRRSKLMVLTAKGTQLLRQVMRREGSLMHELAAELAADNIRRAAETLQQVLRLLVKQTG